MGNDSQSKYRSRRVIALVALIAFGVGGLTVLFGPTVRHTLFPLEVSDLVEVLDVGRIGPAAELRIPESSPAVIFDLTPIMDIKPQKFSERYWVEALEYLDQHLAPVIRDGDAFAYYFFAGVRPQDGETVVFYIARCSVADIEAALPYAERRCQYSTVPTAFPVSTLYELGFE